METTTKDIWEFLDTETTHAEAVRGLVNWSQNYDLLNGTPYQMFLDLTGLSEDIYGTKLIHKPIQLGFVELDYLGDALKEYATYPTEVTNWIEELNQIEWQEVN